MTRSNVHVASGSSHWPFSFCYADSVLPDSAAGQVESLVTGLRHRNDVSVG